MIDYYTISGLATLIIHTTKFVILLECDCAGAPTTLATNGIRSSYLLPLSSDCSISQIVWREVSDNNYRIKLGTSIAIGGFQVRLISGLNSSITKAYTQAT